MAIYKLNEIAGISRGKGKFYKRHLEKDGDLNGLHYGLLYKESIINSWETTISREFWREDNLVKNGDILLIDVSESFDELGHFVHYSLSKEAMAGNHTLLIKPKNDKVISKYLYYLLRNQKSQIRKFATGDKVASISLKDFSSLMIDLPLIKEQQKIIDIIEPIEKTISAIKNQLDSLETIISKFEIKETGATEIFSEIKTGKLNTNVAIENGKYNFYTCGSKILKSNMNTFSGRYILLSGNGELYSWWEDGEFDLYQRVYALTPKDYFFTSLLSVKRGMKKLRYRSNGAVIKFIKINDIHSIKLLDTKHEKELEVIYKSISKYRRILSKNESLLNNAVKFLIK